MASFILLFCSSSRFMPFQFFCLTGLFQAVLQNMPEGFQPIPGRGYNLSGEKPPAPLPHFLTITWPLSDLAIYYSCFRAARRLAVPVLGRHATWILSGRTDRTCVDAAKANGSPATARSVLSTSYSVFFKPWTEPLMAVHCWDKDLCYPWPPPETTSETEAEVLKREAWCLSPETDAFCFRSRVEQQQRSQ